MEWNKIPLPLLFVILLNGDFAVSIRLYKLFQYLDGYRSDYNFKGILHVGDQYAVFVKTPKPHSKILTYELYQTRDAKEGLNTKPRILAVANIPVEYIKDQLKTFRAELYTAKYLDKNVVPGTRLDSLKEWQIDEALKVKNGGVQLGNKQFVIRSVYKGWNDK